MKVFRSLLNKISRGLLADSGPHDNSTVPAASYNWDLSGLSWETTRVIEDLIDQNGMTQDVINMIVALIERDVALSASRIE